MMACMGRYLLAVVVLLLPAIATAQTASTAASQSDDQLLKPQQLEALVAPIALYPDGLLSEVLMASTYPTQVVQAERWVENTNLKGDALKSAAETQPWDDSVKALVATPDVLAMMSKELEWTQKLGDAVVNQEADLMDAVQRLRAKAQANNKLESTSQQKVTVRQEAGRQLIAIEPSDPGTIYVPYYDPAVVYGGWPYSDYPPYYWGYPGYIGAGVIATGLAFGAGYALGRWASGGCCWNGSVNWNRNNINVGNGNRVNHFQSNRQQRVGNTNRGGNRQMNFRGRNGQQVLNPGNRGNRGNQAHRGNRPTHHNAGNRGGGNRQATNRARGGHQTANRARGGSRQATNRARGGGAHRSAAHRGGGHRSVAHRGGGHRGGARMGGGGRGGGGARAGGGGRGGGGRGGGGRRSDIALKHDVVLLGRMSDGLGFYRFSYNGSNQIYVGVIAQEVQTVMPQAVRRDRDGYLRVFYEKLGVPFETYQQWIAKGAHVPAGAVFH